MKEKSVVNARKINKMRFISGIAICSLVIIVTFVALSLSLSDYFKSGSSEAGIGTLKMFTTISNVIAAFAAAMCLPFQIDGLRTGKYKLPSWIVILMYAGTVGVFLTFITAITLISAYQGFVKTMLTRSSLFMHTINPLLITVLFVLVVSDTHIKFSYSFISIIPAALYMVIYFILVFVAKVWSDHYKTDAFFPYPVSIVLMISVTFGVSQVVRIFHNLSNKYVTKNIVRYYKESPDFEFPKVSDAIAHLAELESKFYKGSSGIYIPLDEIQLLYERYNDRKVSIDKLYDIYLENYLISVGKREHAKEE